jgi:ribonuclease Z
MTCRRALLIGLALCALGCEAIQGRMMEQAARAAVQPPHVEWLDDDALHVILCGTGSPIPAEGRAGPCTAVMAGGHFVLVDVGPGSFHSIGLLRLPIADLSEVLITHYHSDHIGEIGEIGMQSWANGRKEPLVIYGPPGLRRVVGGFEDAYALDTGYRIAHHGKEIMQARLRRPRTSPVRIAGDDLVTVFEDGELRVAAFRVDHDPIDPAYGYRFDYKGRSVVVSGDTSKSANLTRHAKGADLLVHEALAAHMLEAVRPVLVEAGYDRRAKIVLDVQNYHTTPVEAAETAAEAGVDMLVLTHLVPAPPNAVAESLFLRGVSDAWDGEVVLGEDGMHFTLPAGGDAIERSLVE